MNKPLLKTAFRVWLMEILFSGFNFFVLMNLVYEPRWGVLVAHQIGMSTRIVYIFIFAYGLLRFVKVYTLRDLVYVGFLWLVLTLLFEWGGSFAIERPVEEILIGWNIFVGYMWPYVLLTYLLSNLVVGMILRATMDVRMNTEPKRLISPTYFNLFLLLMIIFYFVVPIQTIVRYPFTLSGILPLIIGLFINLQARRTLREKRTTDNFFQNATALITKGVFQYSRNPMYLGGIIFSFGLAILLGSLISLFFPIVLFLLLNFIYVLHEEDHLQKLFGEAYLDYMKRVRRWI